MGSRRRRAGRRAAGNLKVVTTNLRPGYMRKNGAPYSDKAAVTEYFDLNTLPNGDQWLTADDKSRTRSISPGPISPPPISRSCPTPTGWNPTPCSVK